MRTPMVSIITLNYKEANLTKRNIELLLQLKDVLFEIIIIDNNSGEKEKKALKEIIDKRVRFFFLPKNIGCSLGYNLGIKKAKGKYVFIVNNDTEVLDTHALSKMKIFMDKNINVAVIQPKIKSIPDKKFLQYAGAAGGYLDVMGYPFCRGRIFDEIEEDRKQYDTITDISWASTCAFFARKSIVEKVGLFEPIYFAYAEEVDMCLKIWKTGYKVVFFPYTEIYHRGESSWKKIRERKTFLIHRNHLILYFKCLPLKDVIKYLPLRIFFEICSICFYLLRNKITFVLPVILANLSIIFTFPLIIRKRAEFMSTSRYTNRPFYNGSIVLDHFVLKKNTFSSLEKSRFKNISSL